VSILIISSLSITVFCMALLLGKQPPSKADRFLLAWLGIIVVNLAAIGVVAQGQEGQFPFLLYLSEGATLLHGPLLWLYTLALTSPAQSRRNAVFTHLAPFLLAVGALLLLPNREALNLSLGALGLLSILAYALAILRQLNRHERQAEQVFSYVESVRLRWLRHTVYVLFGMLALGLGSLLLFAFTSVQLDHYGQGYTNVFLSVMVWLISYNGVRQHAIFSPHWPKLAPEEATTTLAGPEAKYQHSGLKEEDARRWLEQLRYRMQEERLYADPELSLYKLADRLALPPHHLSQVINAQAGQHFYDFVNGYRVDAFKEAIQQGRARQLTLLALAYEVGFNSKASFNRAFKKFTGQTPQQYLAAVSGADSAAVQPIG